MGMLVLLFIVELIIALVAATVAAVFIFLPIIFPPRVVRPLPQIYFLDAHPRHVCRGDTVTVNWRAYGESGLLLAARLFPGGPFYREPLDRSRIPMGMSSVRVTINESFQVTLEVFRSSTPHVTRNVLIYDHDSTNEHIELILQRLTFTRDPRPGWVGRRVFSSDPREDADDWSLSIQVAGLSYPEAFGPPGGPRPTRDMVRDVIVSRNGRELATLTTDQPDDIHVDPPVTVVGEWELFVAARPGEGPDTPSPVVRIELMPRCVVR